MVLDQLARLLGEQYACDEEDVTMTATLDSLNLSDDDRSELMLSLEELYGIPVPTEAMEDFVTVEDVVAYIEDRL